MRIAYRLAALALLATAALGWAISASGGESAVALAPPALDPPAAQNQTSETAVLSGLIGPVS